MSPLLCLLLLAVSGAVSAVPVVNGRLGRSVYFSESITIKDDPLVIWSSSGGPVARWLRGESRCYGRYTGRCHVFVNGTLRLDGVTLLDDGMYSMTAENSTSIEEARYDLRVYAALPVNESVGGSIHLEGPEALPTAHQILWYYNVNTLIALLSPGNGPKCSASYRGRCELFQNGTLRLDNLTIYDQGKYTLLVQDMDNVTSDDYHYQLQVYGDVNAVSVLNGRLGDTIYFQQSVSSLIDPFAIWFFNNKRAALFLWGGQCYDQFNGRCEVFANGTLRLDNLEPSDEGKYSMVFRDGLTIAATAVYELRLYPSLASQRVDENLGGSAYLFVSAPLPASYQISIYFNENTLIVLQNSGSGPRYSAPYRGRCQLLANATLKLDNLTSADQGEYTVIIQDLENVTSVDYHYQLYVYGPLSVPALSVNSTSNDLANGSYVSLHCNTNNQAATNYSFYQDQRSICSDPGVTCRGSYLYFQPIRVIHSGNYSCSIENPVSFNVSDSLQLHVIVPVFNVQLTTDAPDLVWPGMDTVSLSCSAEGQEVSYSWTLQGVSLIPHPRYQLTQNNATLTISPVEFTDWGPIFCTASNQISSEHSNVLSLKIAYEISNLKLTSNASDLVWVGEDWLHLHCTSQGTDIKFSWRLGGQQLPDDHGYDIQTGSSPPHSNLTIRPVSRNDSGPFSCSATNIISGMESQELSFNLAWTPEGFMNCSAEPMGPNVQVGCSWPGGNPAANVSMTLNGVTEEGQETMTRVVSFDNILGSNLSCHGDQLHRQSMCTVIFEPPQAPGHNDSLITESELGETVNLTVTLTSGLPSVFSWYHLNPDPIPIPAVRRLTVDSSAFTSSLQIPNVTPNDGGRYECRAANMIGSQNFLFTLRLNTTGLPSPPPATGLSGGAIAGIVIGVLVGVTLIGLFFFFVVRKTTFWQKLKLHF